MKRPFGVSSLALLAIIAGITEMLVSFARFASLGLLGSGAAAVVGAAPAGGSQELAIGLAVFLLVLSCLYIVFALGALQLAGWAWPLGVALTILTVLNAGVEAASDGRLTSGEAFTVIIAILVLVYLYNPRIRKSFGRIGRI
jgi:hypothetical protein